MFYLALLKQAATPQSIDAYPVVNDMVAALYCVGLLYAPHTSGTVWLMPLIIAARLLLVTHFALVRKGTAKSGSVSVLRCQITLVVLGGFNIIWQGYSALQVYSPDDIRRALFSHPAVSALGFDFILSVLSSFAWMQRGLPALNETSITKKET
jgi:hypothetical protein